MIQVDDALQVEDKKYIVFKREDFYQLMGELMLPTGNEDCAPVAAAIIDRAEAVKLPDAVVIRTKDPFSGPALHSYAAGISLYTNLSHVNGEAAATLREVSHYFHERAMEADATFEIKLPD
jgi:hypothetical protein